MPADAPVINVAVAGTGNNVVINTARRSTGATLPGSATNAVRGIPGPGDVPQVTPGTGGAGGKWRPRGGDFCGVPDAIFDLCGNSFAVGGYGVVSSYEGGVGQFHNVPAACVTLVSNLAASCPGQGARPTFCGADCIQYKGVEAGFWGWFTETLQRVFTSPPIGQLPAGGKPPGGSYPASA